MRLNHCFEFYILMLILINRNLVYFVKIKDYAIKDIMKYTLVNPLAFQYLHHMIKISYVQKATVGIFQNQLYVTSQIIQKDAKKLSTMQNFFYLSK